MIMSYNMVSDRNSTTALLGGGATFTGVFEDVSAYAEVVVSVFTDQISGALGFDMQGSSDGINTDASDSYNIPINTNKTFKVGPGWKFFRMVYTNGATPQGAFRLQTNYKMSRTRPSSIRMVDGRSIENGGTISWTSKFGNVTFNQYGKEFPTGGMNENGLVIELMWLNEARYPGKG